MDNLSVFTHINGPRRVTVEMAQFEISTMYCWTFISLVALCIGQETSNESFIPVYKPDIKGRDGSRKMCTYLVREGAFDRCFDETFENQALIKLLGKKLALLEQTVERLESALYEVQKGGKVQSITQSQDTSC